MARTTIARRKPDEATLLLLGQVENQLALTQLAWQDMLRIANDYEVEPTLDHANRMLTRKTLLANAARHTLDKAVEAVGGGAYFRPLGLEQLWRDVQGAPFHPLPEQKQLAFTGRLALGLPPT